MKISFAAAGTKAEVKEDINQQARALYEQHKGSRTLVGAIAQEIGRVIADHSVDEDITVTVDVDIDISESEAAKLKRESKK